MECRQTQQGIEAAADAGLKIKINCVPIKGINDKDILDVLEFCKEKGYVVRFIEFMENNHAKDGAKGLNSNEILEIISKKYPNIKIKIYTANITKQLKLDFEKYQKQYKNIEINIEEAMDYYMKVANTSVTDKQHSFL